MRVMVCVKRVPFTGGKVMSGNLRGFRSSGRSTAVHDRINSNANPAGFAALLTFPGMGSTEKSLLATRSGRLDKVVAGLNPATIAMRSVLAS